MKTVIVRTPETDRRVVTIPTLLTDLTDYVDPATLTCGGTATMSGALTVPSAVPVDLDNLVFSNLINCDADGAQLLEPLVAGMFLIVAQATMSDTAPFAGKNCSYSVLVNGVPIGTVSADTSSSAWSGASSFVQRLAVGDTVGMYATNAGGGGGLEDITIIATFTIYRIGL